MSEQHRPKPSEEVMALLAHYEAKQREIDLDLARLLVMVELIRTRKDGGPP